MKCLRLILVWFTLLVTVTACRPAVAVQGKPVEDGIRIEMADGLQIVATFWPGAGETPRPALIALHIVDGRRQSWQYFAPRLNERGYSVLAIDMRGDGQTGGQIDWVMTQDDLRQVYRYLIERPDVDPTRVGFIGSSIGANL